LDDLPLPWTLAYEERRNHTLRSLVEDSAVLSAFASAAALPSSYGVGLDERCVELPWALSQLPEGPALMLDAGSSLNHAMMLDQTGLREKRLHIVTLTPEAECHWQRGISYVFDDIRELPFRDGLYDVVVSISSLEHVGCDNTFYGSGLAEKSVDDFPRAVREMSRVLRPGGLFLLTVPYGVYQFHGAFQQFDRARLRLAKKAFGAAAASEECFYRYSADGWQLARDEDCSSAEYVDWVAELMRTGRRPDTVVHQSDYAAAARAVACVRLIKA
jgi:SAM-dependent methyltransferase